MTTQSSFLPEKSHGPRSLVGHSPQGHKSWIQLSNSTTATTSGIRSLGFLCFALKVFTCYFLSWSFQPFIIKNFKHTRKSKEFYSEDPSYWTCSVTYLSTLNPYIHPSILFCAFQSKIQTSIHFSLNA